MLRLAVIGGIPGSTPPTAAAPPAVRAPDGLDELDRIDPDGGGAGGHDGHDGHASDGAAADTPMAATPATTFELTRVGNVLRRVRDALMDDPARARAMLEELAAGVHERSDRGGVAQTRLRELAVRLDTAAATGSLAPFGAPPPSALDELRALKRRRR